MAKRLARLAAALVAAAIPTAIPAQPRGAAGDRTAEIARAGADIRAIFEKWAAEQHVPGLSYGVVADGKLVLVGTFGVKDQDARAPVTADTRFRIASMSKAFTALAILDLRDQGKLSLDDLAERHVPEMRGWTYPTSDAPRIRIRDLLTHTAGFVDDNPWGDRQQPLTEAEFSAMLKAGVPFSRPGGSAFEYSNFGYATLGRIVSNVSGKPYQRYVAERFFRPLGMSNTVYDVLASPRGSRAIGYRWQDDAYLREPDMADGAFGAMGGIETTANDYARYVAWLLSAWPPRDGAESGPLKRATIREIVQGSNFMSVGKRRASIGPDCAESSTYGMGWRIVQDCETRYLVHTGGYPGYGSVVMLWPEAGIGVFAFSSRTYTAPVPPAYHAAMRLRSAGLLAAEAVPVSPRLAATYAATARIWTAGDVLAAREALAMNVLMDRSAERWKAELARLRAEAGACRTDAPIEATTAMAGRFSWTCDKGRIDGSLLLAPTAAPTFQELRLAFVPR